MHIPVGTGVMPVLTQCSSQRLVPIVIKGSWLHSKTLDLLKYSFSESTGILKSFLRRPSEHRKEKLSY
jgi:hypothetical protein